MRAILRAAAEKIAEVRLRHRCDVMIGDGTKVYNFRAIAARPPARLTIGAKSMFQGSIAADHPAAIVTIGSNTFVGGSRLVCAKEICIGDNVLISWGCTLVDHDSHSLVWEERQNDVRDWHYGRKDWSHVTMEKVTICDKAWIGFNVVILKGVTVGEGAVVGACSVVTKDVEPYTVVAGNPARLVKRLSHG